MESPIKVLHVDDDPALGDLVSTFLERFDEQFRVKTATSATEGLDHLNEAGFDCIVSDYEMPGQDGIQFLKAVRDDYADLPFILFTGRGSEEVASDAIRAGGTDYLQKGGGTDQYELLANRVRNTVEQYRATREARTIHRRLQELAETTTDCLWMFTRDWDELLFISGYEDVWNRPAETIEENPQDFLKGVDPDHQSRVKEAMNQLSDGKSIDIEYKIRRGDDDPGWVWVKGEPVFDENGNVVRVVGFTREITERYEHQQKLKRKERRYQAVFNDPNILVGLIDTDGTVLNINQTAMEYIDASPEAVTDSPFSEGPWFDHSESLQDEVQDWIDRAARGNYVEFEADLVRPDGQTYTVEGAIRPVRNDHGEVVSLLISDRDITEQRARERELERSEARYRSLTNDVLDTSDVGAFVLNSNFEIVWINKATEKYFGIDRDAVVGTDKRQLIHDHIKDAIEDADEFASTVLATYDDNTYVEEFECHILSGDDRDERWLKHWSQPIKSGLYEGGRIEHYTDITARKRREQDITQQNERMAEFASIVSHDLRNPLDVAEGHLELAQGESESEHLDVIERTHERMDVLIDDLLTRSRECEEVNHTESIDLSTFSESCWRNVATAEATLRTDVEREIEADSTRLRQLLENLMRNAVEHGGRDVMVTVGESDGTFYVEDDGQGIPEDEWDKLFEAGYSTVENGSGFGLSIVNSVAQAHSWDVRVADTSAGDTRFEITGVEFATE